MACPNGCIGGGGQPAACNARKVERNTGIFVADEECVLASSDQNPDLAKVYEVVGDRAHELFHIHYPSHNL